MRTESPGAKPQGVTSAFTFGQFAVAASVLCMVGVFLLTYQFLTARDSLRLDVETLATIIGKNSAAPLMFSDPGEAKEILKSFESAPYLVSAIIFDRNRSHFSSYEKEPKYRLPFPDDMLLTRAYRYGWSSIQVVRPVELKGHIYGYVLLTASMASLHQKIFVYAFFYFLASLVALGLSVPLVKRLRRQIVKAEERLDYYAFTDEVTGLPNRRAFQLRLAEAASEAGSARSRLAVLFLDVDDFKSVNDTLGHVLGDQLLRSLAERISKTVKDAHHVFRVGGDEFGIILHPIKRVENISHVAQRVLSTITKPCVLAGHQVFSTVSIGASIFPDDTKDLTALIRNADMAMYAAKKSGKNRFQHFNTEMFLLNKYRLEMERDIRRAVENNEFVVFYQPQFCARSNTLIGVEALLRWSRPDGSMVGPAQFIPVAESTGIIVELGKWVLLQACTHTVGWARLGLGEIQVSVNVSAQQLRNPDLLDDVIAALEESGLGSEMLELELTESLLMDDVEAATLFMKRAQNLGVRISIDDFGTGYSSLAYLQNFPLDRLKIDQSFIRRLPESGDAIINAIIGLARSFDLEVVAEGVESEAQLKWLRTAGCDVIQGFLLGKPMNEGAMRQLLHDLLHEAAAAPPGTYSRPQSIAMTNLGAPS